ncbi:nuclear transport factor 2 family protein [Phnomibacter sp. MR]|uniref:nuclear transport factor 2 family protein n=1 Tax=Phnomibacter sp. MR TaxID=3042318 RepID=UPI003A813AE2
MKIRFAFVAFAICLSTALQAQQTPAEKFVANLAQQKNKWLIAQRYDSLRNILDARCLYVHSNGWTQTASEVIADMQSGKLRYQKIHFSDVQARQFESMVIVTGKGQFEGNMQGKSFAIQLAFTEVYVKRKASWKLVSRHACKIE